MRAHFAVHGHPSRRMVIASPVDLALKHAEFDRDTLIEAFERCMEFGGVPVTRAQFEANLAVMITDVSRARSSPLPIRK